MISALHAQLFEDLPTQRLLRRLALLDEAGRQSPAAPAVLDQQQPPVAYDDRCRRQYRRVLGISQLHQASPSGADSSLIWWLMRIGQNLGPHIEQKLPDFG